MPVISVTLGKGQVTTEQKENLILSFTESAVDITRLPAHAFTILINELADDSIGVGGKTLAVIKKTRV